LGKVDDVPTYSECKIAWENAKKKREGYHVAENGIEHGVTARDFQVELFTLAMATGDARFMAALTAISDLKLTRPDGGWVKNLHIPIDDLHREVLWYHLFERIEKALLNGTPLRNACAQAAAKTALKALSFNAAVKQAERIWQTYKSRGLQLDNAEAALNEYSVQMVRRSKEFMLALDAYARSLDNI
jgi:hypothetical protein